MVDKRKFHRVLELITLLQSGSGDWTAARLALEFGVHIRTVYRDLQDLNRAGIPCFCDEETGFYRIRGDYFMRPVDLTLEESLALILLADRVGGREQVPLMSPAQRAIAKVRGMLPPNLRDELAQLDNRVDIRLRATGDDSTNIRDIYDDIRQAIAKRRTLECDYESPAGGASAFELQPYSLLFSQRAWYVLGHHSEHQSVRCLKLARFESVRLTRTAYKVPTDFSVEGYLGNAWRMIRGKKSYDVAIRFDGEFADTIEETWWHKTQHTQREDDGSLTFTAEVDGLDEIVWWVLSMGPHCKVIQPRELAEKVRQLARAMVSAYE